MFSYLDSVERGGFNFENHKRNKALAEANIIKEPTFLKTGTTIAGLIYKDGLILGADTKATGGSIVFEKNCEKLHYLAPNIYCAGAGTAADCDHVTKMVSRELELHRLTTGTQNRVAHAVRKLTNHLFQYQGHVGAALIIGGIDIRGPHLVSVSPYGNHMYLPFITTGSGSLAAMSVMETRYKAELTKEEGIDIVRAAIEAGITHDEGSGFNVDILILTKDGVDYRRPFRSDNVRMFRKPEPYEFIKGTTEVFEERKFAIEKLKVEEGPQPMELS